MSALSASNMRISAVLALSGALLACSLAAGCASPEPAEDEGRDALGTAAVRVDAPGWDAATSTPVVLVFTAEGEAEPAFARAVAANADVEVELSPGSYGVEVVVPVNADGSTYAPVDAVCLDVAADGEGERDAVCVELEPVSAADVTEGRMAEVLSGLARAVAVGDETLAGDAGRAVVERAGVNAAACPAVGEDAADDLASAVREAVVEEPAAKAAASASAGSTAGTSSSSTGAASSGSSSGSASASSSSSSSNSSSSSGSGSGSASSGSSSAPSSPAHSHAWTAVTEQRWVVDQAAWDEPVYSWKTVCSVCQYQPSNSADLANHQDATGHMGSGGSNVQTGTVHHDEVGHYETVTVGYSCSCGASK